MSGPVSVTITQQQDYRFLIDFGAGLPSLLSDEDPPLGLGVGPGPTHLLLAATANCLTASLLFALRKFKQDAGRITATATAETGRNEAGRLRILGIDVTLTLAKPGGEIERLDHILDQFEEFCTVSKSVQAAIPTRVGVIDGTGARLK